MNSFGADRRVVCLGIFATVLSAPAAARGMYCTRHPTACRERREREAAAAEREMKRRALLTPEQRKAEDDRREAERRAMQAKWDQEAKERAERLAASYAALWKALGGLAVVVVIVAGPLAWLSRQRSGGTK